MRLIRWRRRCKFVLPGWKHPGLLWHRIRAAPARFDPVPSLHTSVCQDIQLYKRRNSQLITFSRFVVESTVGLVGSRANAPSILIEVASTYKVETDAMAQKVRPSFSRLKLPQPAKAAAKPFRAFLPGRDSFMPASLSRYQPGSPVRATGVEFLLLHVPPGLETHISSNG